MKGNTAFMLFYFAGSFSLLAVGITVFLFSTSFFGFILDTLVFFISIYAVFYFFFEKQIKSSLLFTLIAILYNPFYPPSYSAAGVFLGGFIDIISAIIFFRASYNIFSCVTQDKCDFNSEIQKSPSKSYFFKITDLASAKMAVGRSFYVCLWLSLSEIISTFILPDSESLNPQAIALTLIMFLIFLIMAYLVRFKKIYYLNPIITIILLVYLFIDFAAGSGSLIISVIFLNFAVQSMIGWRGLAYYSGSIDNVEEDK